MLETVRLGRRMRRPTRPGATFWGVFDQLGAIFQVQCLASVRSTRRRPAHWRRWRPCGLKRRQDAERDGDRIYAIVKGVGSSSDGRGAAILTPHSDGQVLALQRAYRDAEVDPLSIGYFGRRMGRERKLGIRSKSRLSRRFTASGTAPSPCGRWVRRKIDDRTL